MNVFLWILQGLLAFWNLSGGFYLLRNEKQFTGSSAKALPRPAWMLRGALQLALALGLLVPALSPFAAAGLAALMLFDAIRPLTAQYAGFPGMLWPLIPGIVAAFVAYGRLALQPL